MTPTSTFPYQSQGPIDFSPFNFVRTEQIEHLVPNGSGTLTLSYVEVNQSYDPAVAYTYLILSLLLFLTMTLFWVWFFAKKQHKP